VRHWRAVHAAGVDLLFQYSGARSPQSVPAIGVREQFRHLLQNDQALILFAAQAVVMVMNTLKFGAAAIL
jgi:hypothetical protein